MKLLALGTVAFDAIETPFGKTDKILGGAATFIGLAASVLGVESHLISVVGGDFPSEYLDLLKSKNIDVTGVEVIPEGKSFFWSGKYHLDLNARETLVTELNVLENFDPKIPSSSASADVLMLGNLDPSIQLTVLKRMKQRPKLVILDTMNFWINNTWDLLMDVIAETDVITINDEEARQLSGESSLAKAAKKIHYLGPKYVIIKKGEHGALLFGEGKVFAIPALLLEDIFDPTGAGDTFAGGFAAYLTKCEKFDFESMKTAIIVGSALASFTVEKFGTEKLQEVTPEMLKIRISDFKKLTSFEKLY